MAKKLLAILLTLSMVMGCFQDVFIPTAYATEEKTQDETKNGKKSVLTPSEPETNVIYVSKKGNDTSGNGSQNAPFQSLSKAVANASDGSTIYLLDDLVMNECVRVNDKSVTIDGNGHRVVRGKITPVQDNARSTYNPAMFEINNWSSDGHHVLTFKNIILDDDGIAEGDVFTQQSTDGSFNNENKVQDAMIASYTDNTIVLKNNVTLQNYGGMSAVRLTSDAKLVMEAGSKIIDTKAIERGHSAANVSGQAGAIWSQGGVFEMAPGSFIGGQEVPMNGRALYVDGGTFNVGGTISNIVGNKNMWFGYEGVAIHLRNEANVKLSGTIENLISPITGGDTVVAIRNIGSNFETLEGSKITGIKNMPVLFAHYSKDVLGGIIENCEFDYLIRATYNDMTFTKTALIQNNTCKGGAAKAVVYSTNGAKYKFNGQMLNNDALYYFYIINHGGSASYLEMNEGAKLVGMNKNTGVYVNASGSSFVMNGGEISQFSTGVQARGKENSSGTFTMNGGRIFDNSSYGLYANCAAKSGSKYHLNSGIIENNGTDVYISGGNAQDANENVLINKGVLGQDRSVAVSLYKFNFPKDYDSFQIGKAKQEAVDGIKAYIANDQRYAGWSVAGASAVWIKPSTNTMNFKFKPVATKKTGLFAIFMPLNEDGTPRSADKGVIVLPVENKTMIDINYDQFEANTAYAMMMLNNNIYTLRPDDTSKYTGGGQGQETSKTGFPIYTLTDSLDNINSLEIDGVDTGLQDEEALEKLKEYLDITYTDQNGKVIENDLVAGDYIAKLTYKQGSKPNIRINGNEVALSDIGGHLIIRYVSDKAGAISGEITYPLVDKEPTEVLTHCVAMAKQPMFGKPTFYINKDADRKVQNIQGISLLDDDLLKIDENDIRRQLLEQKAIKYLGINEQVGSVVNFDFHYLDLVDAFDGNVWVSSKDGVTVYMPYPENTTKDTEFSLVHYMDLHREYKLNGHEDIQAAIEHTRMEKMNIEKLDNGIRFEVGEAGFSPFALVWVENPGSANVTVQYIDKDTNKALLDEVVTEVTIGQNYDVTNLVKQTIAGYHQDHIEGAISGQMTEEGTIVKVYYLNDAPIIKCTNKEVVVGETFDPLKDVQASDYEDGDLTKHLQVIENTVNTNVAGVYKVTYIVKDCLGKSTTKTIEVVVKDKVTDVEPPVPETPDTPEEPQTPQTPSTPSQPDDTVNTGDNLMIYPYVMVAIVSLVFVFVLNKKKKCNK